MIHSQFIETFNRYKPIAEYHSMINRSGFKETADNFGITPLQAATAVRFFYAHEHDPKSELLSDSSHYMVVKLASWIDLSNAESTRKDLVNKFRCHDLNGPINSWPDTISKQVVVSLFKAFNLKWFYLKGVPYLHWNQV